MSLNDTEGTGLLFALFLHGIPCLFHWFCIVIDYAGKNCGNRIYIKPRNTTGGSPGFGDIQLDRNELLESASGRYVREESESSWSRAKLMDCLIYSRSYYRNLSNHCEILIPVAGWPVVWVCLYATRVVSTFFVWRNEGQFSDSVFGLLITLPIFTILFEVTWPVFLFRFRLLHPAAFVSILYTLYFIALFGVRANYSSDAGLYTSIPEFVYCLYVVVVLIRLLKDEKYSNFMSRGNKDYVTIPPISTSMALHSTGRLIKSGTTTAPEVTDDDGYVEVLDPVARSFVLSELGYQPETPHHQIGPTVGFAGYFVKVKVGKQNPSSGDVQ